MISSGPDLWLLFAVLLAACPGPAPAGRYPPELCHAFRRLAVAGDYPDALSSWTGWDGRPGLDWLRGKGGLEPLGWPDLADLDRFPSPNSVRRLLIYNLAYQAELQPLVDWLPQQRGWAQTALWEARDLADAWTALADAQRPGSQRCRRGLLQRLRVLWPAFYADPHSYPILPFWRLPEK